MPGEIHNVIKTDPGKIILEYLDNEKAEEVERHLRDVLRADVLHIKTRWAEELRVKYRIADSVSLRSHLRNRWGVVCNDIELLNAFHAVKDLVDARHANLEKTKDSIFSLHEMAFIIIIYKQDIEALKIFLESESLQKIPVDILNTIFKFRQFNDFYSNFLRKYHAVLKEKLTPQQRLQLIQRSIPYYKDIGEFITTSGMKSLSLLLLPVVMG